MKLIDKYRDIILGDNWGPANHLKDNLVCVNLKNVADWFYLDVDQDSFSPEDFPCLAPPWPASWYEWTRPTLINIGGSIHRDMKMRIGVLLLAEDISSIPDNVDPILIAAAKFGDLEHKVRDPISFAQKRLNAYAGKGRRWMLVYKIFYEIPGYAKFDLQMIEMKYLDASGMEIDGTSMLFGVNPLIKDKMDSVFTHDSTGPIMLGEQISQHKTPVQFALSFIHCKNVNIIDTPVPRKVADKRSKKGKHPGHTFKVLEIGGLRNRSANEREPGESDLKRALHICRGHFRTYTEENPLFGHFVGTVWVPMHARGNEKYGVVNKDYSVRRPE